MKMRLAEEQLVRGQRQQEVHKMPDKKQAPPDRGLPLGTRGLASSGAHSICLVCHHQPRPPVTKRPHLLVRLRARFSPAVSFFFHVSPLAISFSLSLLLLFVHFIIPWTNIPLALRETVFAPFLQIVFLVYLHPNLVGCQLKCIFLGLCPTPLNETLSCAKLRDLNV